MHIIVVSISTSITFIIIYYTLLTIISVLFKYLTRTLTIPFSNEIKSVIIPTLIIIIFITVVVL